MVVGVLVAAVGASMTGGARDTSCAVERQPAMGINPTHCLRAQRLIGTFDFLHLDDPIASFLFLFVKIEEGALAMTSTTIATGPTSPTGG